MGTSTVQACEWDGDALSSIGAGGWAEGCHAVFLHITTEITIRTAHTIGGLLNLSNESDSPPVCWRVVLYWPRCSGGWAPHGGLMGKAHSTNYMICDSYNQQSRVLYAVFRCNIRQQHGSKRLYVKLFKYHPRRETSPLGCSARNGNIRHRRRIWGWPPRPAGHK
jgi:hypothetical protein